MCSFVEMNLERFVPFFVVFLFGIVMFLLGFQREEVLLSPEESEDFENPIQENENHDSRIQKLEEMRQGFYNEMNRKTQDYILHAILQLIYKIIFYQIKCLLLSLLVY